MQPLGRRGVLETAEPSIVRCTSAYSTRHNRLLYYKLFDTSGESDVLLRTVRHTYYAIGTVCNISIQDEWIDGVTPREPQDCDVFHDLALYYFTNDQLWRALWSHWEVDEGGEVIPNSFRGDGVREFRYDDPRGRYLAADFSGGEPSQRLLLVAVLLQSRFSSGRLQNWRQS